MKSREMCKKIAVVTGGTRGIGAAVSWMLLNEGYDLLVTYVSNCEAARAFEDHTHHAFPNSYVEIIRADQSDFDDVHNLVEHIKRYRRVDCIVLNAGVTLRKALCDVNNEEWLHAMNTNVNSNVFMIRDLLPIIADNSRIVFVGSMMAIRPHATSLAYGVTKSAVHALALNLVKVFEGTGTTVNVVAPGFVETEWQKEKPAEIRKNICNKTAVKRFAAPDEIADAVRFCLNNPFVNGSVIEVSGGYDFK